MVKINFPSRIQQNLSTAEEKTAEVTQKCEYKENANKWFKTP